MEKGVNNGQEAELFVKTSSAPGERDACDAIKHMDGQGRITDQLRGSGLRPEVHSSLVEDILDGAGKILKKCLRMIINSLIIPGDLINYYRWRDSDKR